jgi:hypothetical protein
MITDRVRAARAGSSITVAFLARDMGREYARDWLRRREEEGVLLMPANPYGEALLRSEWEKGFWFFLRDEREAMGGDYA